MFTFAYSKWLLMLLLLPVLFLFWAWARFLYRRRIAKFGNPKMVRMLMPDASVYKPIVKVTFALIAIASMIIALARPWGGVKDQTNVREGIEIVIAVDASNSMLASATDKPDGVSRMRTSKLLLEKLINSLGNDRVGLLEYAASAYTLIPITNDYVSAKAFLNSIEPSQIPNQGTNISEAIDLAARSFSDNKEVGKAVILLTDAEELEDKEAVINTVKNVAEMGIQVDVIGIGSSPVTFKDDKGHWMTDEYGQQVETALDEEMAIEIANAGNGIYVSASNNDAIPELEKQLGKLKKMALGTSFSVTHDELYIIFAIIAFVCLIIYFVLADTKNSWLDKISFSGKKRSAHVWLPLAIVTMSCVFSACGKKEDAANDLKSIKEVSNEEARTGSTPFEYELITGGIGKLMQGNYMGADTLFLAALEKNNRSLVAPYNSGMAKIMQYANLTQNQEQPIDSVLAKSLFAGSLDSFMVAANAMEKENNISSKAAYNIGNIAFTQEDYNKAIEFYKASLRLNPDDDKARRNLRIAQLRKKDDENQQDQNQDQQQQQNQDQQQHQNQQQQQQQNQQRELNKLNEQTSEQILEAADRKENATRMRMKVKEPAEKSDGNPYRSRKNW